MISFFLHSVSANLMIAKKRGNARKTPEIVRFRGFEAMISFLASLYGCGTRIRTLVVTESESVALPLGDAALLTDAPHYSRFPRACQELLQKITEFSVNYRNSHHLREWIVAEMPGQCNGAWAEKPTPQITDKGLRTLVLRPLSYFTSTLSYFTSIRISDIIGV